MRILTVLALIACTACATSPESFTIRTPAPMGDAYTCALRKFNELGFTVENADRDAGFIRGSKQTSGLGTALFTGKKYHDQLTVSIFESGDGTQTIRVTAAMAEESALGFGNMSRSDGNKPSDSGRQAAHDLLTTCGEGTVIRQATAAAYESTRLLAD